MAPKSIAPVMKAMIRIAAPRLGQAKGKNAS
jgi:hypothetical protein